jgi:hypothetical protein
LAATANGLPDETRTYLAHLVDDAEQSDLLRQDRILARQERDLTRRQETHMQGFFSRLGNPNKADDPTDMELNAAVGEGRLTPTMANYISNARDNPGGSRADAPAFADLLIEATSGNLTPTQVASRAQGLGLTVPETSNVIDRAMRAQEDGPLGRPDIKGAIGQLDRFYPNKEAMSLLGSAGIPFLDAQRSAIDLIADRVASRPFGQVSQEEINTIVRQAVIRTFPSASQLPPVLSSGAMSKLGPIALTETGEQINLTRPASAADLPAFRTTLDLAAQRGVITPDENAIGHQNLEAYEESFNFEAQVSALNRSMNEVQKPAGAPAVTESQPMSDADRQKAASADAARFFSGLLAPKTPTSAPGMGVRSAGLPPDEALRQRNAAAEAENFFQSLMGGGQ